MYMCNQKRARGERGKAIRPPKQEKKKRRGLQVAIKKRVPASESVEGCMGVVRLSQWRFLVSTKPCQLARRSRGCRQLWPYYLTYSRQFACSTSEAGVTLGPQGSSGGLGRAWGRLGLQWPTGVETKRLASDEEKY